MDKLKRFGALIIVFLLASLYLTALVLSFFNNEEARGLFYGCVAATFILPVLLYAHMLMFKYLKGRGAKDDSPSKEQDHPPVRE